MRRRSLLRAGVALPLAALAGCAGSPDASPSPSPTDARTSTEDGEGSPTPTTGPRETSTGTPGLDLREANVTGVSVSVSDGRADFDITLHHDDDGEDGYANWWQVERLDGTRLGRRDLLHAHGTREFTRSETVEIPDGVSCVVVRGHDRTHAYGGRAALADLETGATRFVDQGSEPRSFSESDCP
ncbi:MAG: hypothetical protein V5A62_14690 [Haloarculaceae archaeon]